MGSRAILSKPPTRQVSMNEAELVDVTLLCGLNMFTMRKRAPQVTTSLQMLQDSKGGRTLGLGDTTPLLGD